MKLDHTSFDTPVKVGTQNELSKNWGNYVVIFFAPTTITFIAINLTDSIIPLMHR